MPDSPLASRQRGGRAGRCARSHGCLHCPVHGFPINLQSWQALLALCGEMLRLIPEAPHLYKPPPKMRSQRPCLELLTSHLGWKSALPPPDLGTSLSFGLQKWKRVCTGSQGSCTQRETPPCKPQGSAGPKPCYHGTQLVWHPSIQPGWHPGTQPGQHTGLHTPSFLCTLFSCVSDRVSARKVGQTY